MRFCSYGRAAWLAAAIEFPYFFRPSANLEVEGRAVEMIAAFANLFDVAQKTVRLRD